MYKIVKNNVFIFAFITFMSFLSKANAQSLPSNFINSTPIVGPAPSKVIPVVTKDGPIDPYAGSNSVVGNFYNPYLISGDAVSENSYKKWMELPSRADRVALANQLIQGDTWDTKVDSLKNYAGWVCSNITLENQIRLGQMTNVDSFINYAQTNTGINYFKGNNSIRVPVVQANTVTPVTKTPHSVNGIFVGDSTGNVNLTNFNDWYFWSDYTGKDRFNIKPGDEEMGDGPVSIVLQEYVSTPSGNTFSQVGPLITWNVKNGVATLDSVNTDWNDLTLIDPNKIKVSAGGSLGNFNVDGSKVSPADTSLSPDYLRSLGFKVVGDTSSQNADGWSVNYPWYSWDGQNYVLNHTLLTRSFPVNVSYTKSDKVYSPDSTSFTQGFKEYAWITSGGVTALDSTEGTIVVNNLIGNTNLNVKSIDDVVLNANSVSNGGNLKPSDLTPAYFANQGIKSFPDTTNVSSNIPVKWYYKDSTPVYSSDSTSFSFNREFYAERTSFGETSTDSTATPQKITLDNITAVEDPFPTAPKKYELYQNYPNPFNPTTTIKYSIPKTSLVRITIYNLLGEKVKTIISRFQSAGNYKIIFDASSLSSGVYLYKIQAGQYSSVKKFILLK